MKTKQVTDLEQQRLWKAVSRQNEDWYKAQRRAEAHNKLLRPTFQIQPWMIASMVKQGKW